MNILPMIPEKLWPDELIIDEVQHMLASSWTSIYEFFYKHNKSSLLGLTATLYHGSGGSFEPYFREIVQTITKPEAIEAGYITKPVAIVPEDLLAEYDIPVTGDDYDTEKQASVLGETVIMGNVIEYYQQIFTGRPVLVACATYAHAELMTKAFNDAGWKFEHIHSKLQKHVRSGMLKRVANQEINGLCTVGIGIEGMSIKGLWGILWLRRTKSPIIWTQFNGRADRLFPGKKYAVIVDFVGNTFIHGMPDRERKWTLLGTAPEAKIDEGVPTMQKCPYCGVMNAIQNTECHFCGKSMIDEEADEKRKETGRKIPTMIDGEMVALTEDGIERVEAIAEEVKEANKQEEAKTEIEEARILTAAEKADIISKRGLFSGRKKGMFGEAIRDFM
jgi:superfamily II DNA or RNA helicase